MWEGVTVQTMSWRLVDEGSAEVLESWNCMLIADSEGRRVYSAWASSSVSNIWHSRRSWKRKLAPGMGFRRGRANMKGFIGPPARLGAGIDACGQRSWEIWTHRAPPWVILRFSCGVWRLRCTETPAIVAVVLHFFHDFCQLTEDDLDDQRGVGDELPGAFYTLYKESGESGDGVDRLSIQRADMVGESLRRFDRVESDTNVQVSIVQPFFLPSTLPV